MSKAKAGDFVILEGENNAKTVYLQVGQQKFSIAGMEWTNEEAVWFRNMLVHALERMIKEVIGEDPVGS